MITGWCKLKVRTRVETLIKHFFSAMIFISVLLGLIDFSDKNLNKFFKPQPGLRRISCHGRNYSQPYFFKRNQSSDNRSHGFGAKFLLKKLSASDFSYEGKSAFSPTCPICADMLLSIACQEHKNLAERNRKKQKTMRIK